MIDVQELSGIYWGWFPGADGAARVLPEIALHDDFVAFGPAGHRSGRGEFLLSLRDDLAGQRLVSLRFCEQSGCLVARGETAAVPSGAPRRFTSVWVRPAGSDWRCVTHHETEAVGS